MVRRRRATVSGGSGGSSLNEYFHPRAITEVRRKEAQKQKNTGPKDVNERQMIFPIEGLSSRIQRPGDVALRFLPSHCLAKGSNVPDLTTRRR